MKKCKICQSEKDFPRKGSNLCNPCRWKREREADPVKVCYTRLKSNAKRRGKEFTLTLDEFKEFCYKTEYHIGKGRTKDGFSVDRIDNEIGYTKDNIRVMTVSENSSKSTLVFDEYERRLLFKKKIVVNQEDCPF